MIEHDGRAVGVTAIHFIDWKDGHGTTGTTVGERSAWGKGLGGEVMKLRARYAFTKLPLRKLKSGYYGGNVASGKAQAAAGYLEVGRYREDHFIDGHYIDLVVTELHRKDWLEANSV